MSGANHDFSVQVRLHAAGFGDPGTLLEALLAATFFCQAGENPGFLATPSTWGPLIAVFTSEAALARSLGACRWFSTSGSDLLALAPVGHRFVIDPGSRHELVIDPAAAIRAASCPVP